MLLHVTHPLCGLPVEGLAPLVAVLCSPGQLGMGETAQLRSHIHQGSAHLLLW